MSNLNLELLEISDEQALSAVEQVANSTGAPNLSIQCLLLEGEPGRSIPLTEVRADPEVASVLSNHGYLFRNLGFNFNLAEGAGNGSLNFARQTSGIANASITLGGGLDHNVAMRTRIALAFNV
jgi:hypothetical protein